MTDDYEEFEPDWSPEQWADARREQDAENRRLAQDAWDDEHPDS